MSLDILSRDIFLKAQEHKENLEKEQKEEFSRLKDVFNSKILDFKEKLSNKNKTDISIEESKILGKYRTKSKKLILETKNQIIKESLNKSIEAIKKLKPIQREEIYTNLIKTAKKIEKFDEIICQRKDSKIIKKILKDDNIKIFNDNEIEGIICYSNKRNQKIDLTFRNLIFDIFKEKEEEIQKILFK